MVKMSHKNVKAIKKIAFDIDQYNKIKTFSHTHTVKCTILYTHTHTLSLTHTDTHKNTHIHTHTPEHTRTYVRTYPRSIF